MSDFFLYLGVGAPLLLSLAVWKCADGERARLWATVGLSASLISFLAAAHLFALDALSAVSLPLMAGLCLGMVILAPKQDASPHWFAGMLWLNAAMSLFYAAEAPSALAAGWGASILPFLTPRVFHASRSVPFSGRVALGLSFLFVCLGLGFSANAGGNFRMLSAAVFLLTMAVILREGFWVWRSWLPAAVDKGPLLPVTILVNSHMGIFFAARVLPPIMPDAWVLIQPYLRYGGLAVLLYATALSLAASKPRRLFGLISLGQGALLLIGISSGNLFGMTGALVFWQVCAVSMTMLACVYSGLEARLGIALKKDGFLGLAAGAPRLAVFFAGAALCLVGLPLTLGFLAGELLLMGAFEADVNTGVVLAASAAINAVIILRLFMRLFLGRPIEAAGNLADVLPRERWVLAAALLFLAAGGLFPALALRLPALAAERLLASAVPGP